MEALVYLAFGGLVVAAIHTVMFKHQREFAAQSRAVHAQGTLRSAINLLVTEIRTASVTGGDLVTADPTLIGLRTSSGFGVVCGLVGATAQPTYTIALESGEFRAETPDSALALAINGVGVEDDEWRTLKVTGVVEPAPGDNDYVCDWANGATSRLRLVATGDTSGIQVGSVLRPFRATSFGVFPWNGQWWLGRRLRGAGWEPLTGPLRAPADSGLAFTYYDRTGIPTTTAADVAAVEILLQADHGGQPPRVESLRTKVALRGG
jgi:hypothetical protein